MKASQERPRPNFVTRDINVSTVIRAELLQLNGNDGHLNSLAGMTTMPPKILVAISITPCDTLYRMLQSIVRRSTLLGSMLYLKAFKYHYTIDPAGSL